MDYRLIKENFERSMNELIQDLPSDQAKRNEEVLKSLGKQAGREVANKIGQFNLNKVEFDIIEALQAWQTGFELGIGKAIRTTGDSKLVVKAGYSDGAIVTTYALDGQPSQRIDQPFDPSTPRS